MNYRKYITESKKEVLAGKNDEQNEALVKDIEAKDMVFHTVSPGSPFCVIKGKISKKDLKECAVFCAKYSQEWKKAKVKKDVLVHYFNGKHVYKAKDMKKGTFGVKKFKLLKVRKEDIEKL